MINTMDDKDNKLTNQNEALINYIGALVTEEVIENKISEKPVSRPETSKVSTLYPVIGQNIKARDYKKKVISAAKFFEVSVFSVCGLRLGIESDKIRKVIDLPKNIIFADKSLAQVVSNLESSGAMITLINTPALVMANVEHNNRANKVILIKDKNVGFVCDEMIESFILDNHAIRWRTDKTKRKWLAGTVITREMALLDINKMIEEISGQY